MERLSTWSKALTGSKPLFVFDLDSTITKCELLPLIAESVGLGSEMAEFTEVMADFWNGKYKNAIGEFEKLFNSSEEAKEYAKNYEK